MPFQFNDDYAFATAASENNEGQTGMKLRDYFAGQALVGLLANNADWDGAPSAAYYIADAMLKERDR